MSLADTINPCEEIEIAILSDQELSDEEKKHIESCEKCRSLLSQVSQMKNDIGNLSIPGIADGQITEAVMNRIRKEKEGIPFPKFKLTHHLGTAASIVIILVAALIIKNPSADVNNETVTDNTSLPKQEFGIIADDREMIFADEAADEEFSPAEQKKAAGTQSVSDSGVIEEDIPMIASDTYSYALSEENTTTTYDSSQNTVMFAARPEAAYTENEEAVLEESTEESTDTDGILADEAPAAAEKQALRGGSSTAANGVVDFKEADGQSEDWHLCLPPLPDGMESAFEGLEFLGGEENFDYNISLANERLFELFGERILTKELLSEGGCTSNADFLAFIDRIDYSTEYYLLTE